MNPEQIWKGFPKTLADCEARFPAEASLEFTSDGAVGHDARSAGLVG
jgi:hypothetical protein